MKMREITRFVRQYLALRTIGDPYLITMFTPPNIEIDGAVMPPAASVAAFNALMAALNQQGTGPGDQFTSSAAASATLTNLVNLYIKLTNGGAVTITLDSAYNIVNAIRFPFNGQTFVFKIMTTAGGTVAAPTLLSTDVTLVGTTTVTTGGFRDYQGQITQMVTTVGAPMTSGTTFTSLTQVGSSNLFTVALGTNALVPVVGTAILLTAITGTLPPGWYPIVKVTSATSFVIATPAGTVWTATAATVPGTTVIPSSAYTPTFPTGNMGGLYAPLVSITGMAGMAAGVMVT